MIEKIQGAVSDKTEEFPTSQESKLDLLSRNYTLLAQGVVNQHYELARIQLLMDSMISSNPSLKYPDSEEIEDIERKALSDTRATYAGFFSNNTKSVDSDK